ncbi:MAG TPA: MFS transporter [Victivallales bacterium]|nr:MFS transporter [Victivallales bacterium]
MNTDKNMSAGHAWIIWFLCALFYFYVYVMRTSPSIMTTELTRYFSLPDTKLDFLLGAYFYIYAPMQLVAGILFDSYGSKKVLPISIFICIIGSLLFIQENYYIALLGRIIIGAGSAFGFVGVIYVATNWISKKHFSLILGLTQTMGMLGVIFSMTAVKGLVQSYSWNSIWIIYIIVGAALAIILIFIIPKRPKKLEIYDKGNRYEIVLNIAHILKNSNTLLVACVGGLFFMPTTVIALHWGVPFIKSLYGIEFSEAINVMRFVFIGWIFGCPIIGKLDDLLKRHKLLMMAGLLSTLIFFCIFVYVNSNINTARILLFLIGFFSSAQIISFRIAIESNPIHFKGSVIGVTNFIIFLWTAILIPVFGYYFEHVLLNDSDFNLVKDYRDTMILVPLALVIAIILLLFVRKKYYRRTDK